MQLKENGLKKFKSKLMVETWPHVQPFHWEGKCLSCWQTTLFENEKKDLRLSISFGFAALGTSDRRRKETPNKQRRANAESKHRRLEKKESWKTQKMQGKDKVCAFHFYFILWTWCVLGLHNVNAPIYIYICFFFLASA